MSEYVHTRTVTRPLKKTVGQLWRSMRQRVYSRRHTDTSRIGRVAFAHRHAVTHAQSRSHNTNCVRLCHYYLNTYNHPILCRRRERTVARNHRRTVSEYVTARIYSPPSHCVHAHRETTTSCLDCATFADSHSNTREQSHAGV